MTDKLQRSHEDNLRENEASIARGRGRDRMLQGWDRGWSRKFLASRPCSPRGLNIPDFPVLHFQRHRNISDLRSITLFLRDRKPVCTRAPSDRRGQQSIAALIGSNARNCVYVKLSCSSWHVNCVSSADVMRFYPSNVQTDTEADEATLTCLHVYSLRQTFCSVVLSFGSRRKF